MIKHIFLTIISAFVLMVPFCAAAQDFGLDINIGLQKKIIKGLNIAADFELQTQDMSSKLERITAGIDISYKPIDYFKFGAGYIFIDKFCPKHQTDSGNTVVDYWSPRNRVHFYVTGILPIGNFELSLRERYQYTHRSRVSVKKTNSAGVAQDPKIVTSKDSHALRSRLLASYKIKPIKLSPYFSLELYNDLVHSFDVDKLKVTAGMEYTLLKHHVFDLFYRYTAGIADSGDDGHLLGVGYKFKF